MALAHIVPRTYLKGFASRRGCEQGVVVYYKDRPITEQVRMQKIVDVARVSVKEDYYIVQGSNGPDSSIEDGLSSIEALWPKVRKALNSKVLSANEWSIICAFAALQEARAPRNRMMLARPHAELLQRIDAVAVQRGLSAERTAIWKAALERRQASLMNTTIDLSPANMSLAAMPQFMKMNLQMFSKMNHALLTSYSLDLLTSDHPVLWFDPKRSDLRPCASKLSLTAEVTFPLTKRHAIVFSYLPIEDCMIDKRLVSIINARTAFYAQSEIYAAPVESEMEKEGHLQALTTTSTFSAAVVTGLLDKGGTPASLIDVARSMTDEGEARELVVEANKHIAFEHDILSWFA